MGFIDIQDVHKMVRDIRRENGWELSSLATILPQEVKDLILNSHVDFNNYVDDVFTWDTNFSGVYLAKGYRWLLRERMNSISEDPWSWIWKI